MNALQAIILNSYENLKKLAPGFDPLKGHRPGDGMGKSEFEWFIEGLNDVGKFIENYCSNIDGCTVVEGNDGAMCLVFEFEYLVGTERCCLVEDDKLYRIRLIHGCLQAVDSDSDETSVATNRITVVITLEKSGDTVVPCLASIHPGSPDTGVFTEGLHEGDLVYGKTLMEQHHIYRCCRGELTGV